MQNHRSFAEMIDTARRVLKARSAYFWWAFLIGLLGAVDCIVFLSWRIHNPPNNPGGPLAGMGKGIIAWEISGVALLFVGTLINTVRQLRRMASETQESPPSGAPD